LIKIPVKCVEYKILQFTNCSVGYGSVERCTFCVQLGMKQGTITLNWMKRQSLEWHHPTSPWKNKFNVTSSARKVSMFQWDTEGVPLVYLRSMSEDQTSNSDLYKLNS